MLLDEGYLVAALDNRTEGLAGLRTRLDDKADRLHPFTVDISSAPAVEEVCHTILTRFGAVSVLVNNAGLLSKNKCVETNLAEWRRVIHVNLDGAFFLSQQLLPCMRLMHYGRIVNITSMAAKTGGVTAGTAYAVSKGALSSLTFSLARETVRDLHLALLREKWHTKLPPFLPLSCFPCLGARRHHREWDCACVRQDAHGYGPADGRAT